MAVPRGASRLKEYPYLLDVLNIVLVCAVLLCIAIPTILPSGIVIVDLICFVSLLISILCAGITIWELDTPSFRICNVKLSVIIFGSAIFMGIMHFVTVFLTLSGILDSGNAAFWIAIFLCIACTAVQAAKFAAYFRQWQHDARQAGFDFPTNNYGSS